MRKVGGYLAVAFGCFMGVGVLLNVGGSHSAGVLLFSLAVFSGGPLLVAAAAPCAAPGTARFARLERSYGSSTRTS